MSIGLAHETPQAVAASLQSQAYQLPDGTYADLCFGDHHDGDHGESGMPCDACRLAGNLILQGPGDAALVAALRDSVDASKPWRDFVLASQRFCEPRVRGPPSVS